MLLTQIHSHSMVTTSFFSMFQIVSVYIYIYMYVSLSFTNLSLTWLYTDSMFFHVFSKICVAMCLWRWLPYTGYWPEPLRLELWARQTWLSRHPADVRSIRSMSLVRYIADTLQIHILTLTRTYWWNWRNPDSLFWLLNQGKNSSLSPCSRWHSAVMHLIESQQNSFSLSCDSLELQSSLIFVDHVDLHCVNFEASTSHSVP